MLSRLQSGVDAEVKKWEDKVNGKDKEMESLNNKISSMEKQINQQKVCSK